ncbi:MAG: hypothetical protein WCI31_09420 [Prolixibacteraceae bacterium]
MDALIPKSNNDLQISVNNYEAPKIEIQDITIEKGFAMSGPVT